MHYQNEKDSRNFLQKNGRYLFFLLVILAFFAFLIWGLSNLQLAESETHKQSVDGKKTTTIPITGTRGTIMDADSIFLAKDEPTYNVTFYRDGSQSGAKQYAAFTQAISDTIDILEQTGNELKTSFEIQRNENTGAWEFYFGDLSDKTITQAILDKREQQWRSNHYLAATNFPTPEFILFATKEKEGRTGLKQRYQIPNDMPEERMLQVMGVYSEMQMNLFNSKPIVIAEDVPYETVLEIETRAMLLPGMEIAMSSKRVYPKHNLAAQVIGYTGVMDANSWTTLKQNGYAYNDTIGKDGIEKSMEDWLTQNSAMRKGSKTVERNIKGKITRVKDIKEPQDGNNVKLTLISSYQQRAEEALANTIWTIRQKQNKEQTNHSWREKNREKIAERTWEKYPLELADAGAMVVIDMEGRVLAMANYPTYDLNAMVEAGDESRAIIKDERRVMLNYAIHARGAPGSIFKLVTGFAALNEGLLGVNETITDGENGINGRFTRHMIGSDTEAGQYIDYSKAPKCWINNRSKHANLDIIQGISQSCNYFFYEIGLRLYDNGDTLGKYASLFGLTSTTGLELPGEVRSVMASQNTLYDPTNPVGEQYQDSSKAVIVYNSIINHLGKMGASFGVPYEQERMETCALRLLNMAEQTNQTDWSNKIRTILMEELNMTQAQVLMQKVYTEIYLNLNDMKWGEGEAIMAAIGQSVTNVTPVGAARYVAAVANGGDVYNLMIIDSIISPEGEVVSQRTPQLVHHIEGSEEYMSYIKQGMQGVVDDGGTAKKIFEGWEYQEAMAAKTGTAQNSNLDLENHSWFVSFFPYEKPEIAIAVFVPNGFSGSYSGYAVKEFGQWYMDQKEVRQEEVPLPGGNQLSP